MKIRVEIVHDDGTVIDRFEFNPRAGRFLWEAPIGEPIRDGGLDLYGFTIETHMREPPIARVDRSDLTRRR